MTYVSSDYIILISDNKMIESDTLEMIPKKSYSLWKTIGYSWNSDFRISPKVPVNFSPGPNLNLKFVQKQPTCGIQPIFILMKKIRIIGYFYQQSLALTIVSLHLEMEFPLFLDPLYTNDRGKVGKVKTIIVSNFIFYHWSYLGHQIP